MSQAYRVERELTVSGQPETFRVIVKLGKGWGRVQTGLSYDDAAGLCDRLLKNEQAKRSRILYGGYRR